MGRRIYWADTKLYANVVVAVLVPYTGSGKSRRAHAAGVAPVGAVGRLRRGIRACQLHPHGDDAIQHGAGGGAAAALPHQWARRRANNTAAGGEHGKDKNSCCNCKCRGPHGRSMEIQTQLAIDRDRRVRLCCDVYAMHAYKYTHGRTYGYIMVHWLASSARREEMRGRDVLQLSFDLGVNT